MRSLAKRRYVAPAIAKTIVWLGIAVAVVVISAMLIGRFKTPIASAVAPDPVAHWTLDESSGSRLDSVGSNDLTVSGTVPSVAGQVDTAADFPSTGGSKALSVADNAELSVGGETSFSVSMWVNLHEKSTTQVFVGKYGGNGEYAVYYEQTFQRFVFSSYAAGGANYYVLADDLGVPALNTWYRITAVHDAVANTNTIIVNDTSNTASYANEPEDTTAPFTIGAFNTSGSLYPALASIDDVYFWRDALNQAELQETDNTPSNLVGYWKFDEGTGSTAVDSSGSGHDGTMTNTTYASNVPDVAFTDPYSAYFDPASSGRVVMTDLQMNGYTEFTVSGWAYPIAVENRASWFGQNDMVEFGFTDSNTLFCYTAKGEVSWDFNPSTFLNSWHNITCLGTTSELIVYVDGVNVGSVAVGAGSYGSSSDHFSIGAGAVDGGTAGPFSGYIDDVRVYNRGLTPQEMQGLGSGDSGPGGPAVPSISMTSPVAPAISSWNPSINWGDSDICEYSWNNTDWLTVDCGSSGSDIPSPSEGSGLTLYIRAGYLPVEAYARTNVSFSFDSVVPLVSAGDDVTAKEATTQTSATASDAGTGISSYAWTKESGPGTVTFSDASVLHPSISSVSADGTYTLRLTVTDGAGNTAYDEMSLVWDTTAPTIPGTPSVGSEYSNDNTPLWNWTASTDTGSGLAYIAYSVQWSQDTVFSGLGGQAGTTDNLYDIPEGLNMTDSTWYFRVKAIDVVGNESDWSDYGTIHIDTVVPTISNVLLSAGTSNTSKLITWNTDEPTSSKLLYGVVGSGATSTAEIDTSPRVTNHSITLSHLVACSIYYFSVVSSDVAGNTVTSDEQTFITPGCAGSAGVITYAVQPVTTASGGTVSLDSIHVSIPAGFTNVDANFQVKSISHDVALGVIGMPTGMLLAGTKVYDIKALQDGNSEITSFDKPITVELNYTDQDIESVIESSLVIYRWDAGTGWTKLTDCIVNTVAKTVTCTTTHFSTFAIYGTSNSVSSGVARYVAVADSSDVPAASEPDQANDKTNTEAASPNGQTKDDLVERNTGSSALALPTMVAGGVLVVILTTWWLIAAKRRRKKDESQETT